MTVVIENVFEEVWGRIKKETPLKNLTELAEITGITQSGLSKAKSRNEFSASWAYAVGKKYGLLTEWIMTGKGPKRIEDALDRLIFYEELEQWARETGGSKNTSWLKSQIENFFPMFKEWRKRREEGDKIKSEFPSSRVA